jgi:hypothetical protein
MRRIPDDVRLNKTVTTKINEKEFYVLKRIVRVGYTTGKLKMPTISELLRNFIVDLVKASEAKG